MGSKLAGQYPSTSVPVSLSLSHHGSGQRTNHCWPRALRGRGCCWDALCGVLFLFSRVFFNPSPSACSLFDVLSSATFFFFCKQMPKEKQEQDDLIQNLLYRCSLSVWLFSAWDCQSWLQPFPVSKRFVAFHSKCLSGVSAAP